MKWVLGAATLLLVCNTANTASLHPRLIHTSLCFNFPLLSLPPPPWHSQGFGTARILIRLVLLWSGGRRGKFALPWWSAAVSSTALLGTLASTAGGRRDDGIARVLQSHGEAQPMTSQQSQEMKAVLHSIVARQPAAGQP